LKAEGFVVETRIEEQGGGGEFSYKPVVVYQYTVGGASYRGDRLSFGGEPTDGSHSEAEGIVSAFPKGKPVAVQYDPADPARAVLYSGVRQEWLRTKVGVGLFFVASGIVGLLWPEFFKQ
jgi:hypothetical protein